MTDYGDLSLQKHITYSETEPEHPATGDLWASTDAVDFSVVDLSSTLTMGTGVTGSVKLYGYGKLRLLILDAAYCTESGDVTIATTTEKPNWTTSSSLSYYNDAGTGHILQVLTSGIIRLYKHTGSGGLWGSVVYLVA